MNARDCALYCQRPYDARRDGTLDISVGDFYGSLIHAPEGIVLAIAGTCDEETALTDLQFIPRSMAELSTAMFGGVVPMVRAAWTLAIYPRLQAMGEQVPIYVVGHSLGAAAAQAVGALMIAMRRPPERIVAFNPPKVWVGKRGPSIIGDRTLVYRHARDPVSIAPLQFIWDWQHGNTPIVIGNPEDTLLEDHALSACIAAAPTEEFA